MFRTQILNFHWCLRNAIYTPDTKILTYNGRSAYVSKILRLKWDKWVKSNYARVANGAIDIWEMECKINEDKWCANYPEGKHQLFWVGSI